MLKVFFLSLTLIFMFIWDNIVFIGFFSSLTKWLMNFNKGRIGWEYPEFEL
jgi:hypothetical protein